MTRQTSASMCVFAALFLPGASIGPYLATSGSSHEEITTIRVAQIIGCKEDSKTTAPDTECRADVSPCKAKTVDKTFNLSVNLNGVIVSGGTGVAWTISVPAGCDPTVLTAHDACARFVGIQWTDNGGPPAAGDQWLCVKAMDNMTCKPVNDTGSIEVPANILAQLAGYKTTSFEFPETNCLPDRTTGFMNSCPLTNGGQTWYYVARQQLCQ